MDEPVGLGQRLKILLSDTQGKLPTQYMQITSEDGFSVNIVLLAPEIVVEDKRTPGEDEISNEIDEYEHSEGVGS